MSQHLGTIEAEMSSSGDDITSLRRRNPHRTCRPIVQELGKCHTPGSDDNVSVLHSKETTRTQDLHPARPCGLGKTRNYKQKPQAVNLSDHLNSLQKSTHQLRRTNGHVSSNSCEPELNECTILKSPAKTAKRSRKGRTKADKPSVPTSNGVVETPDNSEPTASSESCKTAHAKGTCSRASKKNQINQTPSDVSTGLTTCTTLSLRSHKQKSSRHTKSDCSSGPHTPKRADIQPRPLLSSTPNSNGAESSFSPCQQNVAQSSPVKVPSPDVTPSRRLKPQRLTAAGRKKRNMREWPSSSRPLKRCRKNQMFLTESPQDEPSVETSSSGRLLLENQNPEPDKLDESMSSDLSIELSLQEELLYQSISIPEEEEDQDNEDEELPSFLQQDSNKSSSISEGLCVWCKLRKYPYWPAVVKSVNHKSKKASIVFIDGYLTDQKRTKRGFPVALRTLKPFKCEEYEKLVDLAKEKYGSAITWSLELISDYRIRIGCGSFTGSLIEYCAADISCPVRRKYSEGTSGLTFPSQEMLSEQNHSSDGNTEDIVVEEQPDLFSKKVLPDRKKAARNRANQQLVDFIANRRKVERHLLAVINGQESSQWMRALRNPSRQVVNVYLEDDEQVDKVYSYLNEVCDSSTQINTCLEKIHADRITLILNVLLPEAIIHAIAGVHKLSLEKAEEKYRSGPDFSKRERQEFDMLIEKQMKKKQ